MLVELVNAHKLYKTLINKTEVNLSLENKLLIFFHFVNNYPNSFEIGLLFGVSSFIVSKVIHEMSIIMCEIMYQFIPNKFDENLITNERFSNNVLGVIDGTTHPIRRPSNWENNRKTYRSDKKFNFIQTHLIVGWDRRIIAVSTNWEGSKHDTNIRNDMLFEKICGQNFLISDTGFQGIPWIISGLKSNQIRNQSDKTWDKISRASQIVVEHVNSAIKKSISISKETKFFHERTLQLRIILFACGLYNWALVNKLKYLPTNQVVDLFSNYSFENQNQD